MGQEGGRHEGPGFEQGLERRIVHGIGESFGGLAEVEAVAV